MINSTLPLGFSAEAQFIEAESWEGRRQFQKQNALGIEGKIGDDWETVANDCRDPNWDGYGALPVEQETLRLAYCFCESLPMGFPAPSVGAEPDGDVTLEWRRSRHRTLSVSVTPDSELHYAALLGPDRYFGTVAFNGEVPKLILDLIRRVYRV